ncbi:MAG: DinB family protein [Candidatus Promineifilaceae bacterium]
MLDFTAVRDGEMTMDELIAGLTVADLRRLTDEMVDRMLALIADCTDEDVVFMPWDPNANDAYALDEGERGLAWTLGHVIVHTTASAEESAALAAELARGVAYHGRSRAEAPWRQMKTIGQCRARLEESRRMRLASLAMWPDEPHWENTYVTARGSVIGPVKRFVLGLSHDDAHLEQIADIVRQAKAARGGEELVGELVNL